MKRAALHVACCVLFASCEAPAPPPPPVRPAAGALAGQAARVGDVLVGKDQVARIVAAQGVSATAARELAIRDALFASEARAQRLDAQPGVQLVEAALLARVLVKDIAAAVEAQGPVTDAELDDVTARHWIELDRPDAARTVHAVVTLAKGAPPEVRAAASALADAIHGAVSKVAVVAAGEPPTDPRGPEDPAVTAFRAAATEIPKGDRDVRVEALPPVVADGRIVSDGGGRFDAAYARAAHQLERRGDVSPVIETPFGFHVLLLLERVPGHTVPRDERRRSVREEVMSTRARLEKERLSNVLRSAVAIHRDVDAVLALVPVER